MDDLELFQRELTRELCDGCEIQRLCDGLHS